MGTTVDGGTAPTTLSACACDVAQPPPFGPSALAVVVIGGALARRRRG